MKLAENTCGDFVQALASKSAVPGGGGAAALVGAVGMALGSMVCNLTIGKKKYKDHEDEVKRILAEASELEKELLKMIDEDAENFLPLSKAYGMPKDTEEEKKIKEETLELALKQACKVPVEIVRVCSKAIALHSRLVGKSSVLAVSDIGVGVQCLRSAIISGKLNVLININSMKDKDYADEVRKEIEDLVFQSVKLADEVYEQVEKAL